MAGPTDPTLLVAAGGGLVGGLALLIRGMAGYSTASRIGDTAASRIAALAAGEVLVSGTVEPAELTLVSPFQSVACVYYRSTTDESDDGAVRSGFREERAVGFRVRDASGEMRVFPRGARFDVPDRFDEATGPFGEPPIGLRPRSGSAWAPGTGEDREARIAALLTVRPADADPPALTGGGPGRSRARRYREARIEPGEVVTVVGLALPFDQLADPIAADRAGGEDPLLDDPEIAADLAAARAAGALHDDPADAWGNAAIPGFGIGRPVRPPELDADAARPAVADPAEAARFERTFHIPPSSLVLAALPDVPLVVSLGPPAVAAGRHERRFLVGLLGAVLAIASAMVLAVGLGGGLGS